MLLFEPYGEIEELELVRPEVKKVDDKPAASTDTASPKKPSTDKSPEGEKPTDVSEVAKTAKTSTGDKEAKDKASNTKSADATSARPDEAKKPPPTLIANVRRKILCCDKYCDQCASHYVDTRLCARTWVEVPSESRPHVACVYVHLTVWCMYAYGDIILCVHECRLSSKIAIAPKWAAKTWRGSSCSAEGCTSLAGWR